MCKLQSVIHNYFKLYEFYSLNFIFNYKVNVFLINCISEIYRILYLWTENNSSCWLRSNACGFTVMHTHYSVKECVAKETKYQCWRIYLMYTYSGPFFLCIYPELQSFVNLIVFWIIWRHSQQGNFTMEMTLGKWWPVKLPGMADVLDVYVKSDVLWS
jgi:hypothetical protein